MTWWSLSLFAWFIAVVGHALLCRSTIHLGVFAKFLLVAATLGVGLGIASLVFFGYKPEALTSILVYAFLCELYAFLFTMTSSSVSASLLLTLAEVSETTEDKIEARYSSGRMVLNRLHKLERSGLLKLNAEGKYGVTRMGYLLIQFLDQARRFFRLD